MSRYREPLLSWAVPLITLVAVLVSSGKYPLDQYWITFALAGAISLAAVLWAYAAR